MSGKSGAKAFTSNTPLDNHSFTEVKRLKTKTPIYSTKTGQFIQIISIQTIGFLL